MEEIGPNQNNNQLNLFKEEVLSHIKDLENKLTNQISSKELKLNKEYDEFTSKMNSLIANNKEMISNMVSQKVKIEKITELESFKNKVDSMLITHELRIKNSIDEIEKIKTKYDKIVTDNLYVSGFIGNSCQFRNVSEYLSYNITEVSRLKMEKDQSKKDLKDIKNKLDGTMKNMITLNDNSVKLCNKYTDHKQEEFNKLLQTAQAELSQKSMEMRAMIVQFHNESDQKVNNLKKEFDKLLDMKQEFIDLINEKYISFEKKHEELDQRTIKIDENINLNKNKIEELDEQEKTLEKSIKDLNFQVRNYYCVNNKIAGLLEKLGANPSKSEIAKLLLGIQTNSINNESKGNKTIPIPVSPQPKRRIINKNLNLDLLKMDLESSPTKTIVNNNKGNLNKSVVDNYPKRKSMFNISVLKKLNFGGNNNTDSESSDLDETIKKDEAKNNEKIKDNLKSILKHNLKQTGNNIIKEKKENNKENNKVGFKDNNKKNLKINIKDNLKENINEDIKDINKEKFNTSRAETASNKNSEKLDFKNKIKELPILSLGNKEMKTLGEVKRVNLSALSLDKNSKENNKKNLIVVINNDNKIKQNYQKNILKKIDLELEHDQQGCKVVALSLPPSNPLQPTINIIKKEKDLYSKGKYNVVNSLINDYRAKLFSKARSPDSKNDITNDILDIPKKVSQAFGRTTYTFYFKKDAIDCANANKNINNFAYNGPKKGYRILNSKRERADTGNFK